MADCIKGLELCRGFFFEAAQPILQKHFPYLVYSAGLIGYGSDVLDYDTRILLAVSLRLQASFEKACRVCGASDILRHGGLNEQISRGDA